MRSVIEYLESIEDIKYFRKLSEVKNVVRGHRTEIGDPTGLKSFVDLPKSM